MTKNAGVTSQKKVSVTIPTSAAFTVKNDSSFVGASLNITNNGEVPIDISVDEFIDPNGNEGIELVTNADVRSNEGTTYKRNQINLWLKNESENKIIYLGNRKLYSQLGENHLITNDNDKKIATVLSKNSSKIDMDGKAGVNSLDKNEPIRDNFKLILKIKMSSTN